LDKTIQMSKNNPQKHSNFETNTNFILKGGSLTYLRQYFNQETPFREVFAACFNNLLKNTCIYS
jgi:hypothetical protein